jgi:hypothetical protein
MLLKQANPADSNPPQTGTTSTTGGASSAVTNRACSKPLHVTGVNGKAKAKLMWLKSSW